MQRSPCLFEAVKCRWFMQCLLTYAFQIPCSRTTGEEMSSVGIIVKFRVLKGGGGGGEWELGFACFWTRKMGMLVVIVQNQMGYCMKRLLLYH